VQSSPHKARNVAAHGIVAGLHSAARYVKLLYMETPSQLSRQAIEEFKAIYHEVFGQQLSDDQAQEIALRLLRFFGILTQPEQDKISE
jgi:hypothetical protein